MPLTTLPTSTTNTFTAVTETNDCAGHNNQEVCDLHEQRDVFTEDEVHLIEDELHESFLYYSDSGALKRVSELFLATLYRRHRRVVFSIEEEAFFEYSRGTGLWNFNTGREMERKITDFVNEFVADLGYQIAGEKLGHTAMDKVLKVLATRVGVREFFEKPEIQAEYWIHCQNCMLEFDRDQKGWVRKEFDPRYHSRFQCAFDYQPDAVCNRFLEELINPAMDEDDRDVVQLYGGQCLLGKNLSEKIIVCTGPGGGGKSTVANTLQRIIGPHNCAELRLECCDNRFEASHYVGKTVLFGSDVKADFLNRDESRILKKLTGKDPLTVEYKCDKKFFTMTSQFNIWINSNATLRVRQEGDYEAWHRRLIWIRFKSYQPENKIPDFDEVLAKAEGSGILNWFLEGAARLLNQDCHIDLSPKQEELLERLLEETDPVKIFVRDHIVPSENGNLTNREIWGNFNIIREKMDFPPVKRQIFMAALRDAMDLFYSCCERHDIQRGTGMCRGYAGIRFVMNPVTAS